MVEVNDRVQPDGTAPTLMLDLDGVVWLSHTPIPGSVEAIARARGIGCQVVFVTNNSSARVEVQEAALQSIGVPAEGDVVTSAQAAARLVATGSRVMVCGGDGIRQALAERGAIVVDEGACDDVIVGFHREFDYDRLRRAATAVMAGARLIGTNDDATYPTPDGPIPGGGALLAAVAYATSVEPVVAGKPHDPMAALVRERIAPGSLDRAVMVGDRPSTDGRFAQAVGCRYGQVWSGVTAKGSRLGVPAAVAADDLAGVVDWIAASLA